MRIKISPRGMRIKCCYYSCSECGRQIDSYDYYTYGKCSNCRY